MALTMLADRLQGDSNRMNGVGVPSTSLIAAKEPHNIEAEQALLGALLLDNDTFENVKAALQPEHFFDAVHTEIYRAISTTITSGRVATPVTLRGMLLNCSVVTETLDVAQYLVQLVLAATGTRYVNDYAGLIVELARKRRALALLDEAGTAMAAASGPSLRCVLTSLTRSIGELEADEPEVLSSVTLAELMNLQLPARLWALENLLHVADLMMIYASRGVGKTWLVLELGIALSLGRKFLKWQPPRPFRVFHVCGEMHAVALKERLMSVCGLNSVDEVGSNFRLLAATLQKDGIPDLSTPEGQAKVERLIGDAEIIILDNVSTLCRSGKENEAESWRAVQEWLIRLRTQGRTVIVVHHAGKSGLQRGTSGREDVMDVVWALKASKDCDPADGAQFDIVFEKNRSLTGDDIEPLSLRLQTLMAPPFGRSSQAAMKHWRRFSPCTVKASPSAISRRRLGFRSRRFSV